MEKFDPTPIINALMKTVEDSIGELGKLKGRIELFQQTMEDRLNTATEDRKEFDSKFKDFSLWLSAKVGVFEKDITDKDRLWTEHKTLLKGMEKLLEELDEQYKWTRKLVYALSTFQIPLFVALVTLIFQLASRQ